MTKVNLKDNVALMKRFFHEVWNERRIETVEEFLAPDFIAHYEHKDIIGINNWREDFYEMFLSAIPDINLKIQNIIANEENVVTHWKAQGSFKGEIFDVKPSGEMIEFSGMSWVRIVDGKIGENWNNWNMSYLLQLLKEVRVLRGILPLCSFCKKVRDDKGYWEQIDVYIDKYSDADVSHSICPDCAKKNYPDIDPYDD